MSVIRWITQNPADRSELEPKSGGFRRIGAFNWRIDQNLSQNVADRIRLDRFSGGLVSGSIWGDDWRRDVRIGSFYAKDFIFGTQPVNYVSFVVFKFQNKRIIVTEVSLSFITKNLFFLGENFWRMNYVFWTTVHLDSSTNQLCLLLLEVTTRRYFWFLNTRIIVTFHKMLKKSTFPRLFDSLGKSGRYGYLQSESHIQMSIT